MFEVDQKDLENMHVPRRHGEACLSLDAPKQVESFVAHDK